MSMLEVTFATHARVVILSRKWRVAKRAETAPLYGARLVSFVGWGGLRSCFVCPGLAIGRDATGPRKIAWKPASPRPTISAPYKPVVSSLENRIEYRYLRLKRLNQFWFVSK